MTKIARKGKSMSDKAQVAPVEVAEVAASEKPVKPAKPVKAYKSMKKAAKSDISSADIPAIDVAKAPIVESRFSPRNVDGVKHFSRADMMELQLAEARTELARYAASAKLTEAQEFQKAAQKRLEELSRDAESASKMVTTRAEALQELHVELGQAYGVDLKKIAYDDVTGKITVL